VLVGDLLKDLGVGASAGLACSCGPELELIEQNLRELLWRVDVEGCSCLFVNLLAT